MGRVTPLSPAERTDVLLRARAGVFPPNLRGAFRRYEATIADREDRLTAFLRFVEGWAMRDGDADAEAVAVLRDHVNRLLQEVPS